MTEPTPPHSPSDARSGPNPGGLVPPLKPPPPPRFPAKLPPIGPPKPRRRTPRIVAVGLGLVLIGLTGLALVGWQTGTLPASWLSFAGAGHAPVEVGPRGAKPLRPATLTAVIEGARTCLRQNEPGKAAVILRQAVAEYPDDQDLRVAYGETLMGQQKFAEAYEQYEKALAIGPRDPQLEMAAGTLASKTGRPALAVEHYSMGQTADPSNAKFPLYLGQVQLRLGRLSEAKASLMRAGNLDPDSAIAWGTLAEISLAENKVDVAIGHIARARRLQPMVAKWRLVEAKALKRHGEPEKALGVLLPMDVSERREPGTLKVIAECFGMLGRPADAARAYADASDAKPDDPDLALSASRLFEQAGRRDQAAIYARRAGQLGHADATPTPSPDER